MVGRARTAAARALAQRLKDHPQVDAVVVATPEPQAWEGEPVAVEPDPPGPWLFGARFTELAKKFEPERLLYFSAGSGLLLSDSLLDRLVGAAPAPPPFAVLNNFYSTDFALLVPPLPLPDLGRDNPIGARLWGPGTPATSCPGPTRPCSTSTPRGTPGPRPLPDLPNPVREAVANISTARAQRLLEVLVDPERELVLLGRVGGTSRGNSRRGQRAGRGFFPKNGDGIQRPGRAGAVRSLVGSLLHGRSPAGLVELLAQFGDAVVWDTRVVMAHLGFWPSRRSGLPRTFWTSGGPAPPSPGAHRGLRRLPGPVPPRGPRPRLGGDVPGP